MNVIAVIPAYNEGTMIGKVVKALKGRVDSVIVVDDGSADETFERASEAGAVVLRHFLNRGQGAALQTGFEYALSKGADVLVTFDADGQHDAGDVGRLVEPIMKDEVDVVLGSRFLGEPTAIPDSVPESQGILNPFPAKALEGTQVQDNIPFARFIMLKIATFFTRLTTGLKITDTHNGLRALSRKSAQKIQIRQDGFAHASEILEEMAKHDLQYKEVSVTIRYTEYSRQKGQSVFGSFKIVWDLLVGRIGR